MSDGKHYMTHAFHKDSEFHHHHTHSSHSHHRSGAHVFQLDDVSLTIENIVFKKGKLFAKCVPNTVITHCSLSLHEGETLFLIGESGSGKSMLIDLLCATLPENSKLTGNIWFRGKQITQQNLKDNAVGNINYVPQSLNFLDPLYKYECGGKKKYPHELSGGLARQALISASVKKDACVIIADEPTCGLDERSASATLKKLDELKGDRGCLLVVTHDIDLALKHADRIAIFKNGSILEETSVEAFNEGNLKSDYAKKMRNCMPHRASFCKGEIDVKEKIIIDNLSIKLGDKLIIDDMSQTISASDITCFFGDTGSGKSTLCKAIAGWIKPTSGQIETKCLVQYVCQNPFCAFDPKLTIRKSMAAMGCERRNSLWLPWRKNSEQPMAAIGENRGKTCENISSEAMAAMGVKEELLDRKPSELSGGELQKFAILRALSANPDFLILDEATSMLDVVSQKEIFDSVLKMRTRLKFGLIFVTHDKDLCKKIADRVIYF